MPRPVTPPPEKMIRELNCPDHTRGYFSELVSRQSSRFQALSPIKRGTLYASGTGADQSVVDAFGALHFVRETTPLGADVRGMPSDEFVIWLWATEDDASDTFNADVAYLGDAVANPAYTRTYRVRRQTYETTPTIALGSPLTALIAIKVTAAGSGYTSATVGISGTGTGATAEAVINATGGIDHIIVTNAGTGYTAAPTVTITGTGTGATATGVIQSQSAILTSQLKKELPEQDPWSNEYVQIVRVYELLPGPVLPYTRFSPELGPIQGYRQAVVYANQPASQTGTTKTTYEARDGSSYVAWKIVETSSDGTGSAGNPAYPILKSNFYDDLRGAVAQTSQIVSDTTSVGSLTVASGTATLIKYEPYNDNASLRRKVVETWAVPGPLLRNSERYDENLGLVTGTKQLVENTGQAQTYTSTGLTRYEPSPYGTALVIKIIESWVTANFPVQDGDRYEDERGSIQRRTKLIVRAGTEEATFEVTDGIATLTTYEPFNEFLLKRIIETWDMPTPILTEEKPNDDGTTTVTTRRQRLLSNIVEGDGITGGDWIRTRSERINETIAWEVVETRPIPSEAKPSTKLDEDGEVLREERTFVQLSTVTTEETVADSIWSRTTKEAVTDTVGWKIVLSRPLPGTPIIDSVLDEDGAELITRKTLKLLANITEAEDVTSGVWTRITSEAVTALVGWEIKLTRAIPGTPIVTAKPDEDGDVLTTTKTLRLLSNITEGETLASGTWTRTSSEPITALVGWEILLARPVPGNDLVRTIIDENGDTTTETRTLVGASTITTTTTIVGGTWTKTFEEPVSELVSTKVVQVRTTADEKPSYSIEIPDLVPAEMRGLVPTETTETTEKGTASMPTLATGDISRSEQQLDEYTYRLRITGRAELDLPVEIVNTETNEDKQVVTVTRTLQTEGTSSPSPTALRDVKVINLGNGLEVEEVREIDEVFAGDSFRDEIPGAPSEFRTGSSTEAVTSAGTAAMPSASGDDISKTSEQVDEFTKRDSTTTQTKVSSRTEKRTNEHKQLVTVAKTLGSSGGTNNATTEVTDRYVDGQLVGESASVAAVFDATRYVSELPAAPSEFRTGSSTTAVTSGGTASAPTASGDNIQKTSEQVDAYTKRDSTTTQTKVTSRTEKRTNRYKQLVTVTKTLGTSGGTPSATTDVEDQYVEGQLVGEAAAVAEVFDAVEYAASAADNIPARFTVGTPALTERHTVAGEAEAPALEAGDLQASERQVDAFTKETSVTNRDLEDFDTLNGQDYDEVLDMVVPYTEEILADGTGIGTNRKSIQPLGGGKALVKTFDQETIETQLDAYLLTFPGTANITLPDVLVSLDVVVEKSSGNGESSEGPGTAAWAGHGSWTLSPRSSCEASVAIMPDVIAQIRQNWAHNVPTTHHLFFLPIASATTAEILSKVAAVAAWPSFKPESATIICTGRSLSLKATASAIAHDGGSASSSESATSSGTSLSKQVSLSIKAVHLPPTIHDSVSVSGAGDGLEETEITVHANAAAYTYAEGDIEETDSTSASVSPDTISATAGVTAIPESGVYLYHCTVEPYRYGYVRVHAETVDFADV